MKIPRALLPALAGWSLLLALALWLGISWAQEAQQAQARPAPPWVAAARAQVGVTTVYDGSYETIDYPGGDVARERGVCTDVVIRALRDSGGPDLQRALHEDMKAHFRAYPALWGLSRPDRNIDHRRVPNLRRYFERQGWEIPLPEQPQAADFQPGDLVTCTVPPNLPHIMIVSDLRAANDNPLVIHNIGRGAREEDRLFAFPLTGHYRLPPPEAQTAENPEAEAATQAEPPADAPDPR